MKEVSFLQMQITFLLKDMVSCAVPFQVVLMVHNIKIFTHSNINISYNDNIRKSFISLYTVTNLVASKHIKF